VSVRLADLTTLRVGGNAADYLVAETSDAVIDAVSAADAAGRDVLVLGGGSNLLVGDSDLAATVVHLRTRGIELETRDACSGAMVRVAAGEPWDDVVARAVRAGWAGIEALSGIPGSTGATPIQNVGAYGQEVSQSIASVRTWDRQQNRVRTLAAVDCEFGYRSSRLKQERFRGGPRYIVLEVTFQLRLGDLSTPIGYAEAAKLAKEAVAKNVTVRQLVIEKGLLKGKELDDVLNLRAMTELGVPGERSGEGKGKGK